MKWNLTVDVERKPTFRELKHSDPVLSIGSCFSEHIGNRFESHHWSVCNNPFGILYNPLSIHRALTCILDGKRYEESDLVRSGGRFVSLDHHGDYSGIDAASVLERINASLAEAASAIRKDATVLVTFGTAWYYIYRNNGQVAGNCHKLAALDFDRERAAVDPIVALYAGLVRRVAALDESVQWVFTVSPVRHWNDGAADNQWSKSILTCAVRELSGQFDNVHYFPAYEILMDELRDHRFYKEDLVHPSDQAVEHIWNRFSDACLTEEARLLNREISAISRRIEHRPIHPESSEHQEFLEETRRQIGILKKKHPFVRL